MAWSFFGLLLQDKNFIFLASSLCDMLYGMSIFLSFYLSLCGMLLHAGIISLYVIFMRYIHGSSFFLTVCWRACGTLDFCPEVFARKAVFPADSCSM